MANPPKRFNCPVQATGAARRGATRRDARTSTVLRAKLSSAYASAPTRYARVPIRFANCSERASERARVFPRLICERAFLPSFLPRRANPDAHCAGFPLLLLCRSILNLNRTPNARTAVATATLVISVLASLRSLWHSSRRHESRFERNLFSFFFF